MKTLNITAPPDWMGDALCAQVDHDLFYPEKGGSTKEAKRVCLNCKVRAQCLEYALESADHYGIWGGTSERERRRILARQDAQPEPEQAREAATRRASAEELEDWPTTQEAAELLGIAFNQRTARRLRKRGVTCVKPEIMGPGGQLRWNPQQIAEAASLGDRPQGRPKCKTGYDETVVVDILAGRDVTGSPNELYGAKVEAVRRLAERGYSAHGIGLRVGYHERYVEQLCKRQGITLGTALSATA